MKVYMPEKKKNAEGKIVVSNRKAYHLYSIEDKIEAGIVLQGSEVKSLREGNADISDAYVVIENGEAFLHQAHIAEYKNSGYLNHNPKRVRKLLLHRHEISRLRVKLDQRGYTLICLSIYFKKGKAKLLLGLARGKRKFMRKREIQERDMKRALRRERGAF